MIIFKGTTEETIQKLNVTEGFVIRTQEKVWMDERQIHVWVEDIWLKYTKAMSEKLCFDNFLPTFDTFPAHKTDEIQEKLWEKKRYFDDSARLHSKIPADGFLY